jgi:hypothetical protein
MLFHVTALLLFPLAFSAYQIDIFCRSNGNKKNGIEQVIRDAMGRAFEMVDSALAKLGRETHNQDTQDLVKRLFVAKAGQNPKDKTRMTIVVDVFHAIGRDYHTKKKRLEDRIQQNDMVCGSFGWSSSSCISPLWSI